MKPLKSLQICILTLHFLSLGRKPIYAHLTRPAGPSSTLKIGGADAHPSVANGGHGGHGNENGNKAGDFMYYSDSDEEDLDLAGVQPMTDRLSCNFVDCIGKEMVQP